MDQAREHQVQEKKYCLTKKKKALFSPVSSSLKFQAAGQFSTFENRAAF